MLNPAGLLVAAVLSGGAASHPPPPLGQTGAVSSPDARMQLYPPPKDLFGGLFEPSPDSRQGGRAQEDRAQEGRPMPPSGVVLPPEVTVGCGIRVVPADPSVDPRMPRAFTDPAVHHTIRVVPVPACEPS